MTEKYSEIELKISFNTPAFIGNAKQEGQWRTPPFKALLRQWWRVVKASNDCNLNKIRSDEANLFGNASDDESKNIKSGKSKLRLKLIDNWKESNCNTPINSNTVFHPETKQKYIKSDLYLGYGPITKDTKKYIVPNETNTLWIGFPEHYKDELIETIQLIAWFGTIGSRSRNGWGSIRIESAELNGKEKVEIDNEVIKEKILTKYSDDFSLLINLDWARKIGKDTKGLLIWKTSCQNRFEDVIKELADIKIKYRTHFKFDNRNDKNTNIVSKRYIISYPISPSHSFDKMGKSRNPSQLRFKIVKDNNNKYYGLIFHLPCKVSIKFFEKNQTIKNKYQQFEPIVWKEIHSFLDNCGACSRL